MKSKKIKIDPVSLFSHELKTPISALKLALSVISKSSQTEKNKELIDLMDEELDRMTNFICQQLDFKMLENKTDKMDFEWVSWQEVLDKVLKSFLLISKKKNIMIDVQSDKHYEVLADGTWLRQALENVLSNAIKFSKENSKITINYGPTEQGFKISIKDQGIGLTKEEQNKILKSKKESDGVLMRGTGLGLHIIQNVILDHKGQVEIHSEGKNKGTMISIYLPEYRALEESA